MALSTIEFWYNRFIIRDNIYDPKYNKLQVKSFNRLRITKRYTYILRVGNPVKKIWGLVSGIFTLSYYTHLKFDFYVQPRAISSTCYEQCRPIPDFYSSYQNKYIKTLSFHHYLFPNFFSKKLKNLWWDFGPLRVPGKYPTPRWGSFSVIDTTAFYNFINALTHSGY